MRDHNFEIQTFKGHFFNFKDLENNVIDIEDIAHSLANQCRWTGHTRFFFSILNHSLNAYDRAKLKYNDDKIALEALMHDAPEFAYFDAARPLKKLLPDYTALLEKHERIMAIRLGLPETMSPEVREIDDRLLITEYNQLIAQPSGVVHPTLGDNFYVKPYDDLKLVKHSQVKLKKRFIETYVALTGNKELIIK